MDAPHAAERFTLADFVRFVRAFLEAGYRFSDYEEVARERPTAGRIALMRHDIDFDVLAAARMARVEADLGVRAAYFFLLRTPFYSVFNEAETAAIREILAMGHEVGLHFDRGSYPKEMATEDLAAACRKEASILGEWLDSPVRVLSYHRPGPVEIEGRAENSHPLLNTYMPAFTTAIEYRSDSGGRWRYGHPFESDAFRSGNPIQILIHPIWWTDEPLDPYEVLVRFSARRRDEVDLNIAKNCKVYRTGPFAHVTDS
ncbi:MAG: hypothetical protein KIS66_13580 [Fimbriimonadaceae bacterium]|nr:hypothetical protein [Fimbriimonadaceae bacterium]